MMSTKDGDVVSGDDVDREHDGDQGGADVMVPAGESFPDEVDQPSLPDSLNRWDSSHKLPLRLAGCAFCVIAFLSCCVGVTVPEIDYFSDPAREVEKSAWEQGLKTVETRPLGEIGRLELEMAPERIRSMASSEPVADGEDSLVTVPTVVARHRSECTVRISSQRIESIRCPLALHGSTDSPLGVNGTVGYLEAKYGDALHLGQVSASNFEEDAAADDQQVTAWQWPSSEVMMTLFTRPKSDIADRIDAYLVVERTEAR